MRNYDQSFTITIRQEKNGLLIAQLTGILVTIKSKSTHTLTHKSKNYNYKYLWSYITGYKSMVPKKQQHGLSIKLCTNKNFRSALHTSQTFILGPCFLGCRSLHESGTKIHTTSILPIKHKRQYSALI